MRHEFTRGSTNNWLAKRKYKENLTRENDFTNSSNSISCDHYFLKHINSSMLCRLSQRSETQYRTPTKKIKSAYPYGKTNDHEDKSRKLPITEPVEIDTSVNCL